MGPSVQKINVFPLLIRLIAFISTNILVVNILETEWVNCLGYLLESGRLESIKQICKSIS
jgi:hypothetical protein